MKKFAASILFACLSSGASAQNLEGVASLSVLPGWRTDAGVHMAGLRIELAPGWKTYWRAPGDGGIPMVMALDTSENVAATQLRWPVPEVFQQGGMRSVGYDETVTIPMEIDPLYDDQPIELAGSVTIGVCEEICIPMEFRLSATLPPSGSRDGAIIAALVDRPESAQEAGVRAATCALQPIDSGMAMTTSVVVPGLRGNEDVVVETADPMIWISEPDVTVSGGRITAVSDLIHMQDEAFAVDRSSVRITILGNGRAIDVQGCTGS